MNILKKRIQAFNKSRTANLDEKKIIISSAKNASNKAIRTSRALGIAIKSIDQGKLIEIQPNGSVIVLKEIEKVKSKKIGLTKGMSLCLK